MRPLSFFLSFLLINIYPPDQALSIGTQLISKMLS